MWYDCVRCRATIKAPYEIITTTTRVAPRSLIPTRLDPNKQASWRLANLVFPGGQPTADGRGRNDSAGYGGQAGLPVYIVAWLVDQHELSGYRDPDKPWLAQECAEQQYHTAHGMFSQAKHANEGVRGYEAINSFFPCMANVAAGQQTWQPSVSELLRLVL